MNDPESHTVGIDDPDFDMRRHQPEQRALFPTEDLIVPESLRKMRKAVAAIHAVPSNAEHSQNLNNRRLFDGLIMVAQLDFSHREKDFIQRIKNERIAPLFEVRVSDLARLSGIPGKNYERVHDELNLLYDMSFDWNILGEDNQVIWANKARLLSSLGIGKGLKRGMIRFSMDPDMLGIILEPSLWASLSLQTMRGLGTSASYSLFQATWRYVNTNAKVTAALPTQVWIELLVGKSKYLKQENGKVVANYGEFKRRCLLDAIQRVNDVPVLSYKLELKELRQGNRVARLQFKFVEKQASLALPLTWPEEVVTVLRNIGFDSKGIDDISQAHSSEMVADAILRLKRAEMRLKEQGKSVTARKPYFLGILRNITLLGEDEIDHEKLEAEIRLEAAQNAAEARQRKVQEGFEEHRRRRFSAWIAGQSGSDKEALIKDYWASEDANPILGKLIEKSLVDDNRSGISALRVWFEKHRPDTLTKIFENPEDKTIEAWMAWKLSGDDVIGVQG